MFEQLNQSFQNVFGEASTAAGASTNVVTKSERPIGHSDLPDSVAGVDAIDYDKIDGEANQTFEGLGERLKVVNSSEETEEEEEEEEEEFEDDEEQDFGEDDDPDEDWEEDEDDFEDDDDDDWLDEDDDEEYWDDEEDEEEYWDDEE